MGGQIEVTENHGWVKREDVEISVRRSGDKWQVILIHEPTRTRVEATDSTDMLAKTKAWIRLRDKLEGLDG